MTAADATFHVLTILSELAIAAVIWWELTQNRRVTFLADAFDKDTLAERSEVYAAFLATSGSVEDRVRSFCAMVYKNPDLRNKVNSQITHFNKLGHHLVGRWRIPIWSDPVVMWFPHSVVFMWVILAPYVASRQRDVGAWWAQRFMEYARHCATFLLKKANDSIRLSSSPGGPPNDQDLVLFKADIQTIESDLKKRL